MQQIILGAELSQAVIASTGPIVVLDEQGRTLGLLHPTSTIGSQALSEEQIIAEARRRMASTTKWHTTAEVLDHLKSLDRP